MFKVGDRIMIDDGSSKQGKFGYVRVIRNNRSYGIEMDDPGGHDGHRGDIKDGYGWNVFDTNNMRLIETKASRLMEKLCSK